jgi:succinate dehydrogenase / fumarate reductase cytochrome b subunit
MWLSSLHRITGLLLSAGAIVLAIWLLAAASGEQSYERVAAVLGAPWFKIPLVGWAFCFFFHLANGIRHLAWDTGAGFDRGTIRSSAYTVLAFTVIATAAFAWLAIF